MTTAIAAKDWFRAGFSDGEQGSPRWPPSGPGSEESKAQYRKGYDAGRQAKPYNLSDPENW